MKPAAIDIFSYIVEFSPSMVREFILKEGQNKDDVKKNFNFEELKALNNLSIIINEFQREYKKNQNWHFTISEFFMIKHWVVCWANASICLCDKNCFVHYNNYNVYYKYFFLHLQDDLLINLVIEQMINDTDPGTSSLQ